jgi:hypothetical protein
MTCSGHQRLVVVEGDQIEDDFRDAGMGGAEKGFCAASALLKMEPDYGRPCSFSTAAMTLAARVPLSPIAAVAWATTLRKVLRSAPFRKVDGMGKLMSSRTLGPPGTSRTKEDG